MEPEVLRTRIERFRQVQSEIVTQVRRVIVGQEEVLEQVMIAPVRGRPLPHHRLCPAPPRPCWCAPWRRPWA